MKPQKRTIDAMIRRAAKLWGLADWDLTWKWVKLPHGAEIDATFWTECRAELRIDKDYIAGLDHKHQFRIVLHELGHCVLFPWQRQLSDWTDHYGPKDTKTRSTLDDNINSAENIIIDWIVTRVMGL